MRTIYQIWRQLGNEKPYPLSEAYSKLDDAEEAIVKYRETSIYEEVGYEKFSYREVYLWDKR